MLLLSTYSNVMVNAFRIVQWQPLYQTSNQVPKTTITAVPVKIQIMLFGNTMS